MRQRCRRRTGRSSPSPSGGSIPRRTGPGRWLFRTFGRCPSTGGTSPSSRRAFFGVAVYTTTGYVVPHLTESVGATAGVAGLVLAGVQVTGSLGRLGGGTVADRLPGTDVRANAVVLVVQAGGAAACYVAVARVGSPLAAAAVFAALGAFILGFPGVFYGCMTALVPDERISEATAAGQAVMNLGGLLSPPAFGYLADTLSYDAGWLALAGATLVAGLLAAWLARTN
jgi:predicted MFS family arabinose efflux permease